MSSKDMFRKEQRFSFRKFSFGLASAVIANVIFGGAIANTPVVHANTTTETAAVATSERIASIPYTVNIVDQAGKVVETKEKKVLVYTVETIATATEYLTADLVPEGYAIVSGLGEVTLTEKADNIFTVKVDKIAPEAAATTTTAESATSETSTVATPEPASLTATQPTPVTAEVAEAEVAPTTSEESAKPTERTVYLSYITHYVNEANETVDRTGHLVAVTTTDETAKTQVTVSASENMPSGWELVQDKAKVVVQLVENQTNILVFAVTKKSKEEEIAASQLSNKDVLEQVLSEGVLLSNDAARLLETSQAGNTGLEVATNNTKAVLKEAIQVFDEPTSTQEQVDAQTELVRAASKTLADELLKFDEDGVLTAMLDATTQGITITTSSKGKVRPNYPIHIRDFATDQKQREYENQDFFFGLIGKELTQKNSQIRATAQAPDGSIPTISLVGGGWQPIAESDKYGLEINNSGVIYGKTTITEAGNTVSWQFKASSNGSGEVSKFTFVPYTVVKTDNEAIRKSVQDGVTADEILTKVKSDVTRGDGSRQGPLNATFEEYFNSTLTARATGKSTKVAEEAKNDKQIWHEIVGEIPTTAGRHTVTVRSTNVHGQTIDTQVVVDLYDFEAKDRAEVRKYTDWAKPIHAIIEIGKTGEEAAVVLENIPDDFQIENFNITDEAATKLAERNLEFVKNAQVEDKADTVDNKKDGIVGYIRPKAAYGNVATYTGSSNIAYKFKYKNLNDATADETNDELSYTILFIDTQKPVVTPKSEYIRFVNEAYTISVPGTDNAYLNTAKINGSLSVLKDGETGKVSPGLGTGTNIASELDPTGKGNQGDNSTKFNVNITGTAPSAEGTGTYNLRVGENNYPAGPDVERVDGKKPENVGLTPIKVTFVKRAAVTTPVAVVDPANLTTEEKAAVIAQLKKDNADNQRLQDLPDSAFTVNPDGTVSVDYSAGNTGVDAVTDKVANATVKLADEQKKAKDAIDTKLAEEKAAIEAKRDEAIAEINNTPGLTDDQKKAATDAVTNTANDALTDLQTAADDAKKAIDTETTVAGINNAKTDGEKALDDATATGEAAIDLTKDKELAKADVDNQAKDAIEAVKNNPNLDATEQAPYIKAIEDAAKEQKAAIDAAKDTAGITDAVNAAEKVNEEQKLAAAKEDAKDKIAEEAAAAKEAIDNNPNLSEDEKKGFKDAVDTEVAKANDAIDKAKTPAEAQTAEDNGVKAIDAEELAAAKQDAKNKIAEDVKAAKDAIDKNPNLSDAEKTAAKNAVDDAAKTANDAIDKATTPETVQTAEDNGVKAIDAKELDAAKQDAKNKIAEDVKAAKDAIDKNPNLSKEEKQTFKDAVDDAAKTANDAIDKATTPETVQTAEDNGVNAIDAKELAAAKQDAKNKIAEDVKAAKDAIDNNPNLSKEEKQTFKDAVDDAAKTANDAIDKATTPETVQTAEDNGVNAIDAKELAAAKQDAKNKIAEDVKAAKEAIDNNPNLSKEEKRTFKDAVDKAAQTANDAIDKATTPAEVQTAEDNGVKAIDAKELDAAKQDAKNKIAKDVEAAKDAIDKNPNLSEDEKQGFKDAVDVAAQTANGEIDKATTPETVQTAEDNGVKAIDAKELDAAKQDAKNKIAKDVEAANAAIESNPNLSEKEIADAKAEVAKAAEDANKAIAAATTPETAQAAEETGTKEIAADVLDAAKQDAKNKIAKDVEAAEDAINSNPNLSKEEKDAAIQAVADEAKKANGEIDKATTPDAAQAAEEAGTKAIAADVLDAAKQDAKNKIAKDLATVEAAIDANSNLLEDEKKAAKLEAQAKEAEAVANIEKATTPEAVQTLEDAAVKDLANIEIKAAYNDAVKAIEAADNLSTAAKTQALEDLKKARQAAEDAIKTATTADEVAKGALDGLKSIAKVEATAAADDAKAAIAQNSNLTDAEKKVYTDAIDNALKDTETKIDAATDADTVDAETVLAQKDIAKQEVAAATADAVKGIEANTNLTDAEKDEYKAAVTKAAETAEKAITDATTAADIQSKTFDATQDVAKEEVKADAADAIAGIKANDNLSDTAKEEAIAAIEEARDTTLENIENAKTAAEVDTATLDAEKANAKAEIKAAAEDAKKAIDAAKQGAKNKLMEEADKAKAAIDANPNLTPEEKAAAKAEIDKAVEEAIIAINGAGTHHALGEIKLPLSALIKPVVTVTPVLDPNNLTEEEIARIKALLEENNTFPEGTEIIISKGASVSIKYPDGTIDLVLPAEIVKQADTTAPAITDDAKGNIVVAPSEEAVELVVTYVDNNGKAQLVVVTKGADGKWTTTDKVVIVDPVTGQVIIPGSAIKPGTVVTAYSKDMAGNVSDLNSAEVEAVDANNPAAGVKVKSVTSTSNANKSTKKAKQLPNTGEKATSATSLGLAVLGMGLALFAAKRKKDEEEA